MTVNQLFVFCSLLRVSFNQTAKEKKHPFSNYCCCGFRFI
jgi:hypothetical protein